MASILLIMVIFSIVHFAYENIVAPTLRIYQRNKLFILRDKLRNLDYYSLSKQDKQVFKYIENSLTNCIQNLPYVNIYNFTKYKSEYEGNEELRELVAKRVNTIKNCSITEIKDIFNDSSEIIYHSVWINSGMLFLYLTPIVLILTLLGYGLEYGIRAKNMILSPPNILIKNHDNITC